MPKLPRVLRVTPNANLRIDKTRWEKDKPGLFFFRFLYLVFGRAPKNGSTRLFELAIRVCVACDIGIDASGTQFSHAYHISGRVLEMRCGRV